MASEVNPDWGIGYAEPSPEQIAKWEAIKYQVSPLGGGLYLSGFPDKPVQKKLKKLHIETIVSCTRAEPPHIHNVNIIRVPFDDHVGELPSAELMTSAAEDICKRLDNFEPVLIHCLYGLNRSALLAAHVMARRYPEFSGDFILRRIREQREGALHNPMFAEAVSKLNAKED